MQLDMYLAAAPRLLRRMLPAPAPTPPAPPPSPACRRRMSTSRKDYYEILNVPRNCSDRDIKQAFIKLSKQLHPDKNKRSDSHESFVRVVEAYNVLSKPISRRRYDSTRDINISSYTTDTYYRDPAGSYGRKYGERKAYDETYSEYNTQSDAQPGPGYRASKIPKVTIVIICFGIAFIGLFLQMYIIMASYRSNRQMAYERSRQNALKLKAIREAAALNSNDVQAQLLLKKIAESANNNVATATLAQALASEKPK